MKPKISLGTCRRAIWIAAGIPLMIRGEQVLITRDLRTQGKHWVSGDIRLPRASQIELTVISRAIVEEADRPLIPPSPPTISIRECQEAIEMAGAITITLRGEPMRITELATRDISRWVSGDIRFTPKEKELLTKPGPRHPCGQGKGSSITLSRRKNRPWCPRAQAVPASKGLNR